MPAYTIALELTILLAFWLCLGIMQRDQNTPGRSTFAALTVAITLWCLGEILHQGEAAPEIWADRIRYLGVLSLPPFWLGLAAHATRTELARRVPWFPVVLLAPLSIPYGLLYTGTWSGLFMRTIEGGHDQYGPLWTLAVAYCYAQVLMGCALFLAEGWHLRRQGRWIRRAAVGLSPLVPMLGNAVYIARGMVDPYDPTPLLFGVALVALRGALFTGSLLQALPVSQHDLIQQLPIGVILTDSSGAVIDVNPAAELHLGVDEEMAIGRNLDAVLAETDADVQAEVTPVFSHGREVGQLVLIDPPAKTS